MASRVLVTGATGFAGRAVARALALQGHDVRALVRGPEAERRLLDAGVVARADAGDLEDPESLRAACKGVDAVVHAAAIVDPVLQRDPARVHRVNCECTVELARIAKSEGARRFVFVSSVAAMGFWSGLATAASPCRPVTPYGRAKLAAEDALRALEGPGFEVVALRPPTIYGPGEPYNFLTWTRAVKRRLFFVIGDGKNRFPLVTTENLARAISAGVEGRLARGVYLVGDAEPYALRRIHGAILRALGRRPQKVHLPVPLARAAGIANEVAARIVPRLPLVISRARVETLTVDMPFDVEPLKRAGVALDSPLEEWVLRTVRDYERRGVL